MEDHTSIDIDKLADLSRIQLTEQEKSTLAGQVSDIIGFFQKLQAVDVEGIRPMAHPFEAEAPLRSDEPVHDWQTSKSLMNAPASREDQIVVPKVVEDA